MRGLILKHEHAQAIADGTKTVEYRNFSTNKLNEKIAIVSGDKIYAYVKITKISEPSGRDDYRYAWALDVIKRFPGTKPKCPRKKGQQIWIVI